VSAFYIAQMKMYLKIVFLFFLCNHLSAQNLIPDSSFENNMAIPTDFSGIGNSNSWSRPSMGTTDLFSVSDRKKKKYSFVDVPQNAMGFQFPHSGKSYAGFFLFSHDDYREYLQTPLTEPLKKNKTYLLSMYVNLANLSQTYIDQIGFCLGTEEKHYPIGDELEELDPTYIKLGRAANDTARWRQITARYRAKGGESFIIIGSFAINKIRKTGFQFPKKSKTIINKTSMRDAYYFVDDVSLMLMTNVPDPPDSIVSIGKDTLEHVSEENPLILRNVLFEKNKSSVLATSYSDLDKLADYLMVNSEYKIEISGHTDSTGNENINKKLSTERAKHVAKYLIGKGISKKRIATFGHGAEKPLFINDTEEHKSLNRRVEAVFVK